MKYAAAAMMLMESDDAAENESRLDTLYIRDRARGGFRCLRLVDVHLPAAAAQDDDEDDLTPPSRLQ